MSIEFVTVNAQTLYNSLILQFQEALGETLYQGDERRIFLEQQALILVALYNAINDTGKQNLLQYARGEVLDAFGARTDTPRLAAQKASVTLRFTLSAIQAVDVTIPAGTRATPDGDLFFATVADLVIPAGSTYGDAAAESTSTGETYNGFTAGLINQIVDPIAYEASVANTDTSAGGSDTEADDDGTNVWSGYRERIRESPTKFSTAGPRDAYIYWAKTADANIQDVAPVLYDTVNEFNLAAFQTAYPEVDPTPFYTVIPGAKLKLVILMDGGELPTQGVLDAVLAICNDMKVRPLTDYVTAAAPTPVSYDITLTYYISQDNSASESSIRAAIEDTDGAVDQYKAWQGGKIGRAISPDYLRQLILNAGACRIDLTDPAYAAIDEDEVAAADTVTITYGGLE